MLYLSLLASLIATTTALSIPRAPIQLVWSITNFRASGSRLSLTTTYSFSIDSGSVATTCAGYINTLPDISYLPITACANPIYSFNFQSAPINTTAAGVPGFNLEIWEGDNENESCSPEEGCVYVGAKWFDARDVVTVVDATNPNANYDYLNAPATFDVDYVGTHI